MDGTDVIREAHPLKQGLKLEVMNLINNDKTNSRGASIKTRIETNIHSAVCQNQYQIREAHPLKQGLKRGEKIAYIKCPNIREAHPLKQGLKPTSRLAF